MFDNLQRGGDFGWSFVMSGFGSGEEFPLGRLEGERPGDVSTWAKMGHSVVEEEVDSVMGGVIFVDEEVEAEAFSLPSPLGGIASEVRSAVDHENGQDWRVCNAGATQLAPPREKIS